MVAADSFVTGDPAALDAALRDQAITALLDDTGPSGWSSLHPYRKWQGAFWRLLALLDLGAEPAPPMEDMLERVLDWLTADGRRRRAQASEVDGRARWCATQDGLGIWLACRLGRADDPRIRLLADSLVEWQWPDGGWNCDKRPQARHSSFNETHGPLRGLAAYGVALGHRPARTAAQRAADLLLAHRLFRSERDGHVIDDRWREPHWPPYWHYDVLVGLRTVAAVRDLADGAAADALDLLVASRRPDRTWRAGRRWWKPPSSQGSNVEVVDWDGLADQVVTVQATGVLERAGRLDGVGR